LPELEGKLDGMAIRVPTANVSVVDLTVDLKKKVNTDEINSVLKEAAESNLREILGYTEKPLVSIDFNGCKLSSIVDGPFTKFIEGGLIKILSWYDNETGYSNRLVELASKVL
jgi:glyceraldehyde 3-phosphate dehydrogenase